METCNIKELGTLPIKSLNKIESQNFGISGWKRQCFSFNIIGSKLSDMMMYKLNKSC